MATCDTCGNDYWMAFEVRTVSGATHTFDCFECAVQTLAPTCEHCGCRIIGHGAEVDGRFFCCAHCARKGARERGTEIRDTVGARPGS
jgi:Rieske Fe-S protein